MGSPDERAAEVSRLVQQIKEHPMCTRFEQSARLYRVIYPEYSPIDNASAWIGLCKAEALRSLLDTLERDWRAMGWGHWHD